MRSLSLLLMLCACNVSSDLDTAVQEVTGPSGVTVTVRAEGQLAVNWTTDPLASQYRVFRSSAGGSFTLAASVFDSSGGAPSTSYVDTNLSRNILYCYAIESTYSNGTMSDIGAQGCGTTTAGGVTPAGTTINSPVMSPGNNNNWNPSGFSSASLVRVSTGSGFPFLTGLSGGVDGRRVTLALVSMGDPLTITRLDGSSQLPNQLVLPLPSGQVWMQLTAVDQSVTFEYDGIASKWRLVAKNF
jgi:hypothetical protein